MKKILTGITTTGIPHLGNYVGAIRPAIKLSKEENTKSYLWLANYHSLIKCHDPKIIKESSLEIAATWLACGLDPEKVFFYRQSDIPEILELNWILNCNCAKGLINRAHAYKATVQDNINNNNDPDHGIEMGLYCYPILMAADILMFNVDFVPVGKDQLQHLEMTRDIATKFNSRYKKLFKMPEAIVDENEILIGLDGRKMSKSYGNTIPLFCEEKKLKKAIMKIVTNSKEPGAPKDTSDSNLFKIYKAFASKDEIKNMEKEYENGIAWGEVKNILFNKINGELAPFREKYNYYKDNKNLIEEILQEGAKKARKEAIPFLDEIKKAIGIDKII